MKYEVLPWIDVTLLNAHKLTGNPHPYAIDFLDEYIDVLDCRYESRYFDYSATQYRNKIRWSHLSSNPYAIDILLANQEHIVWHEFCHNTSPRAIEFLRQNPHRIDWARLSMNPSAIDLLMENPSHIYWPAFSANTAAIDIILANPSRIDGTYMPEYVCLPDDLLGVNPHHVKFSWLSSNESPKAVELLCTMPSKIHWRNLLENKAPEAIRLLEQNPDKIDWRIFSENPAAIDLLLRNFEKIDWAGFSRNSAAIDILRQHTDKIHWTNLSANSGIFMVNPQLLHQYRVTRKELRGFAWTHPRQYLILKRFVDRISEAAYNTEYMWCRRRLMKEYASLTNTLA